MVAIAPARELTDLEAIPVLSGLAAGTAALSDEPLNQELVAPNSSSSLRRIGSSLSSFPSSSAMFAAFLSVDGIERPAPPRPAPPALGAIERSS